MDIEDNHLLFDIEQVSKRLDLILAKHIKVLLGSYTGTDNPEANFDSLQMYSAALKESIVELIVQNNHVLWHNVQQLFDGESDDSAQS